ncbi:hypothetical protein Q0M94_28125 (plasmid) [Deinococcus radiomollis]|uniref:hypothetical protein n=1 Tax=Deinococcus radiomollis TaxID=468916 RepID=UPI003892B234
MRALHLMADYDCSPLWEPGSAAYSISPEDLPISAALRESLWTWANTFDATLDRDDPAASGFNSREEEGRFIEEGQQLAERLQTELGMDYQIEYGLPSK